MPDQKYTLVQISNKLVITVTTDLLVGRDAEDGLTLTEGKPSAKHALLSMIEGSVWLFDLKSTNGTYVNDQRVDSKVRLRSNDRLRFGAEEFLFQYEPNASSMGSTRVGLPPAWLSVKAADGATRIVSAKELEEELNRNHAALLRGGSLVRKIDTPLLIFAADDEGLSRVQLLPKGENKTKEWTVGSAATCDVRIQVSGVSAHHAKIINHNRKWKVVSQMAANGVFVNKKRVLTRFLSSEDLIAFGSVECLFCLPVPQPILVAAGNRIRRVMESLIAPFKRAGKQFVN